MRACNVEEAASHSSGDPWEVFTQLVILIIEGRVPGGEKGFHAGPHCSLPHQTGISRHVCDPSLPMCARVESLLRQLRLMWGVGVGVSVEVLVAPECKHGAAFTTALDTTPAPSPQLRLIEQWNFTIYDRNLQDAMPSGWSLVAAVRSFLHFSQLSAWLSVSGGARPPNVLYRLTVTSPVFCSKFEAGSEEHKFPVANVGQETAIKVVVRSLPRSSQAPIVTCPETHQEIEHSASYIPLPSTSHSMSPNSSPPSAKIEGSSTKAEEDLRRSMMRARLGDPSRTSRSESPDTQLGESLLDPPNSLSRIPRRFQSPSRSGSPSLETPEHIICRVRQPGPSHGRPPDAPNFCQPLVIPARQPLGSFAWTQTRYPSVQQQTQQAPYHHHPFHPQSVHSEIFHAPRVPAEPVHAAPQYNLNAIPFAAFPPTPTPNPPQCFYGSSSQVLWTERESGPPQDKFPVNLAHHFPVMHSQNVSVVDEEHHITSNQGLPQSKIFREIQSQQGYHCQQREFQHQQQQQLQQQLQQQQLQQQQQQLQQQQLQQHNQYLHQQHQQPKQPPSLHQLLEQEVKCNPDKFPEEQQPSPQLLLEEQSEREQMHHHLYYHKQELEEQLTYKQPQEQQNQVLQQRDEDYIISQRNNAPSSRLNEKYMIEFAKPLSSVSVKTDSSCPFVKDPAHVNTASSSCHSNIINVHSCVDDAKSVTTVSPSKSRDAQGTKRKGAYNKESPRTKRESPPHVYYSKEGKGEKDIEEEKEKAHEELRKRKPSVEDLVSMRKNCSNKRGIVNDQLWPSCSQSGKHLCSSVEDLVDIADIDQSNFMPIAKSLRKDKGSCKSFGSCNAKVSFDLTPKETQEVLRVLRQNTPVPPLRIDQHKTGAPTPAGEPCFLSKAGRLEQDQESGCLQLLGGTQKDHESEIAESTSSKYKDTAIEDRGKTHKCHRHNVSTAKTGLDCKSKQDAHPTSSNKPCDTSFKEPINYACDKKLKGNLGIDLGGELNDSDEEVLDGLSLNEIELMKELQQKPTKANCIEARTVTQKTNYFTVNSQPTSSTNSILKQTSQALGKSPLTSVLSNIKGDNRQRTPGEVKEDGLGKARRALTFEYSTQASKEGKQSDSNVAASKSPAKCTEITSGSKEAKEDFVKSVNILKHLMKKPYLSDEKAFEVRKKSLLESESYEKAEREEEEEEESDKGCVNGNKRTITNLEEENLSIQEEDKEVEDLCRAKGVPIPSTSETVKFRRSLDSAATLVFHNKTGLPLTSSPAPLRKGTCFDFDSSLNSIAAIRSAFRSCDVVDEECDALYKDISAATPLTQSVPSYASAPTTVTCSNLLGSFEECVLNGRLEPVSTVQGFSAEIAASGAFCPKHTTKSVTVFFYTLCDNDQISSPYMGHINLGKKGYHIPNQGTVQVTLFNPHGTVVKMFVVVYDLSDMPPNSKTFLRQRTLNMPVGASDTHQDAHQWLRYLIHLRFASSKSGKIYLHTDIRMLIFRKSDADAATLHKNSVPYELRSFTHGPTNPKFSPRK